MRTLSSSKTLFNRYLLLPLAALAPSCEQWRPIPTSSNLTNLTGLVNPALRRRRRTTKRRRNRTPPTARRRKTLRFVLLLLLSVIGNLKIYDIFPCIGFCLQFDRQGEEVAVSCVGERTAEASCSGDWSVDWGACSLCCSGAGTSKGMIFLSAEIVIVLINFESRWWWFVSGREISLDNVLRNSYNFDKFWIAVVMICYRLGNLSW